MGDLRGPRSVPEALALSDEINHLKGKKRDLLIHPGGVIRLLYLECEDGEYRMRIGNILEVDMPADAIPKNEVLDGTGSLGLRAGQTHVMPAPEELTVLGLAPKSVLTFYYI